MIPGLPAVFDTASNNMDDVFTHVKNYASGQDVGALSQEELWIQRELQYYEAFYTEQHELLVSITTFNVASKKPPANLASLIQLTMPGNRKRPIDLIMVNLQEIDMRASAMLKEETEASLPWVTGLNAVVGADFQRDGTTAYYAFPPKQLVGLLLCVYLRRPLLAHMHEYSIMTVATGALGTIGNKGAVGLHLELYRTKLCLINAHLASGQNNLAKRNADASCIFMSMDFNIQKRQLQYTSLQNGYYLNDHLYQVPELFPHDHDIIIVAGDLNYRVQLSYDEAVELAVRGDTSRLLKHDEFTTELANPHSPWLNFVDLTPNFPPTYRYNMGTGIYDTSDKQRVPSYTDRIVFWTKQKSFKKLVRVEGLRSLMEISSSDHKPVHAVMCVPILYEVEKKKKAVTEVLRDRVNKLGLDRTISAKTVVEPVSLDFGVQQFYKCGSKKVLKITNTGECVALVKVFRQRSNDLSEGAWLRVHPNTFAILPGETKEVMVECQLHPRCMRWMSFWFPFNGCGQMIILSTLVIVVQHGPMHLVECNCVFLPSVFGNSLDNLMLLRNESCLSAYSSRRNSVDMQKVLCPQLPKELWFLCESIYERGAQKPNLFTDSGSSESCLAIMRHLDTCCAPIPVEFDIYSVATCFITFLRSLQEPVVPFALYGEALAAGKAKGKAPLLFVQYQLPPHHANVWVYVCSLLNFLLRPVNARCNELTPTFLSSLFSDVMLIRPDVFVHSSLEKRGEFGKKTPSPLPQGAVASQSFRQQLNQEKEDAMSLIEYFLVPPPDILQ